VTNCLMLAPIWMDPPLPFAPVPTDNFYRLSTSP
jgi:hypothetical protein